MQTQQHTYPTHTPVHLPSHQGAYLVSTQGQTLPLRSTHIEAEARGGIARITLQQEFFNDHDLPLEVTYRLPLPAEGAVSGFHFCFADRKVTGEVDRKQKARERYERALATGQTAALLEQQRSNQFEQRVGNIPAQTTIQCVIQIDQKLVWREEGAWEWRFPTVVGPRYLGEAGRVKDAAAFQVPIAQEKLSTRTHLGLWIRDALAPQQEPSSPSHDLISETVGPVHHVQLAKADGTRLDRDIVVVWPVAAPEVGARIQLVHMEQTERHPEDVLYGLLTLIPPSPSVHPQSIARDLIFLVDTSGSMGGRPLEQAATLLCAMLDTLEEQDRFECIEFSDRPRSWKETPVQATYEMKQQAKTWLRNLRAGGCTEMHQAVIKALTPLRADTQRQVVLVTDGYIGFEDEILRTIQTKLPASSRFHTIGVGSAVNRALTTPAARAGGGVEIILGLDESAESAVARLLERTTDPIVTEVQLDSHLLLDRAPHTLPDLYAGCPALISLKLKKASGTIRITGNTAEGPFYKEIDVQDISSISNEHTAIAALYGREKIEDLEALRASDFRRSAQIDQQIEELALQLQLSSRLTSWIAVDEQINVSPYEDKLLEEMPHEQVYGTAAQSFGLRAPQSTNSTDPDLSVVPVHQGYPPTSQSRPKPQRPHFPMGIPKPSTPPPVPTPPRSAMPPVFQGSAQPPMPPSFARPSAPQSPVSPQAPQLPPAPSAPKLPAAPSFGGWDDDQKYSSSRASYLPSSPIDSEGWDSWDSDDMSSYSLPSGPPAPYGPSYAQSPPLPPKTQTSQTTASFEVHDIKEPAKQEALSLLPPPSFGEQPSSTKTLTKKSSRVGWMLLLLFLLFSLLGGIAYFFFSSQTQRTPQDPKQPAPKQQSVPSPTR